MATAHLDVIVRQRDPALRLVVASSRSASACTSSCAVCAGSTIALVQH